MHVFLLVKSGDPPVADDETQGWWEARGGELSLFFAVCVSGIISVIISLRPLIKITSNPRLFESMPEGSPGKLYMCFRSTLSESSSKGSYRNTMV